MQLLAGVPFSFALNCGYSFFVIGILAHPYCIKDL